MTKVEIELPDAPAQGGALDIRGARTAAHRCEQAPASGRRASCDRRARRRGSDRANVDQRPGVGRARHRPRDRSPWDRMRTNLRNRAPSGSCGLRWPASHSRSASWSASPSRAEPPSCRQDRGVSHCREEGRWFSTPVFPVSASVNRQKFPVRVAKGSMRRRPSI